jgi:hypothetical protein
MIISVNVDAVVIVNSCTSAHFLAYSLGVLNLLVGP